jgi:hypothetical protein
MGDLAPSGSQDDEAHESDERPRAAKEEVAAATVVLLLVLLVMVVVLMAETSGVWRGRLCVKLLRNDSAGLWEQAVPR